MRVILADDQPDVLSAIGLLLENEAGFEIAGEARDAAQLLALCAAGPVDAVVVDWELPGESGPELVSSIRQAFPNALVVALSSRLEAGQEALKGGADCFVSKSEPAEKLLEALGGVQRRPP